MNEYIPIKTCKWTLTAALFVTYVKYGNHPKCQVINGANKMCNGILPGSKIKVVRHTTIWMNLEKFLTENSQSQKATYCMISFTRSVWNGIIYADRK